VLSTVLVPRRARRELEETLQVMRVAVLNGPRQAGKTTLVKQLVAAAGGSFVTLDDPATLQACLGDPRTFLTAYRKPLVVDEFQLGGDILESLISGPTLRVRSSAAGRPVTASWPSS
jgi:predicted AAA+ superfamily ATPase